jgi:surface protein
MKPMIIAKNLEHLKELIEKEIKISGNHCDLNHIDISRIKKMSYVFENRACYFNGDISKWDMSKVEDTSYMFYKSDFNGDISEWNISSVKNMCGMFMLSKFNGNISQWDVSNVENMCGLFHTSQFNGDVSNWDVSNVKDMSMMFMRTNLNCDISKWNIGKVEEIRNIFYECSCDLPYWAKFEDKQNRINAFDNYWLKKNLDKNLIGNNKKNKRSKL